MTDDTIQKGLEQRAARGTPRGAAAVWDAAAADQAPPSPTRPPRVRWPRVTAVAAAVAVIVVAVLGTDGNDSHTDVSARGDLALWQIEPAPFAETTTELVTEQPTTAANPGHLLVLRGDGGDVVAVGTASPGQSTVLDTLARSADAAERELGNRTVTVGTTSASEATNGFVIIDMIRNGQRITLAARDVLDVELDALIGEIRRAGTVAPNGRRIVADGPDRSPLTGLFQRRDHVVYRSAGGAASGPGLAIATLDAFSTVEEVLWFYNHPTVHDFGSHTVIDHGDGLVVVDDDGPDAIVGAIGPVDVTDFVDQLTFRQVPPGLSPPTQETSDTTQP